MTIHETVYFWQDALYRLNLGKCHQSRLEYSARALKQVAHCHDMAPPQTLGELCIELAQETLLSQVEHYGESRDFRVFLDESGKFIMYFYEKLENLPESYKITRRDIQALRRALYRKHTDPKKERLYQLIDKIRNA